MNESRYWDKNSVQPVGMADITDGTHLLYYLFVKRLTEWLFLCIYIRYKKVSAAEVLLESMKSFKNVEVH